MEKIEKLIDKLEDNIRWWKRAIETDGFESDEEGSYRRDLENTKKELFNIISLELDKAREEGKREVLENELFIGDYDVLEQGLRIRTVDRENFLAQIYKTCKDEYDWAFGTATYDQAIKQIENSLNSTLTPYVGTDKMVDEARIKVLSKLKTKEDEK